VPLPPHSTLVTLTAMADALTAPEDAAAARAVTDAAYPSGFVPNDVLANGRPGHRPVAAFFRAQAGRKDVHTDGPKASAPPSAPPWWRALPAATPAGNRPATS
jgi:hypothetical protein